MSNYQNLSMVIQVHDLDNICKGQIIGYQGHIIGVEFSILFLITL